MEKLIFIILLSGLFSCGESTYEISAPEPKLTIQLLQDSYVVDEPFFVQIKVTQEGYYGDFLLATTLKEGLCDVSINETPLLYAGEWTKINNSIEVLKFIPKLSGNVRVHFEAKNDTDVKSGLSYINVRVVESSKVNIIVECPEVNSITKPVNISLTTKLGGYNGTLPIVYKQLTGTGTLQYGAIILKPLEKFVVPANVEQIFYYTATERGSHKLQFEVTNGTVTTYQSIEFIVTN